MLQIILIRLAFFFFGAYSLITGREWAAYVAIALLVIEYVPTILSPRTTWSVRFWYIGLAFLLPGAAIVLTQVWWRGYVFVAILTQLYSTYPVLIGMFGLSKSQNRKMPR